MSVRSAKAEATMSFSSGSEAIMINIALAARSDLAWFGVKVNWSSGIHGIQSSQKDYGPVASDGSGCSITLTTYEVELRPGSGADGLFIFNMSIMGSVSQTYQQTTSERSTTLASANPVPTPDNSSPTSEIPASTTPVGGDSVSSLSGGSFEPSRATKMGEDISTSGNELPDVASHMTLTLPGFHNGPRDASTQATPHSLEWIAATITLAVLSFFVLLSYLLISRRRRRQHSLAIVNQPYSAANLRTSPESDPLITPFPLIHQQEAFTPSLSTNEDRRLITRNEKAMAPLSPTMPSKEQPVPSNSASSTSSSAASGRNAGGDEIVRATRRAGLSTHALLRSLDRMVTEPLPSSPTESISSVVTTYGNVGGGNLQVRDEEPPGYVRAY
ncbi:hypothetical protein BKA62DRAFT_719869 [Auriculariales sp. MPI-PUGE-AT-0066]|nr:hypothetical protein BKA62DRAFT_719869 [Auriculariales sp. MPI-PUGE-AT-0066]